MSDMNTDTIYATAAQFNIPIAPAVQTAQALHRAAEELRDTVAARTTPDLAALTAKTLTRTHAALVAYANRDTDLQAAEVILTAAFQAVEAAKFNYARELEAPLADVFNDAAQRFTAAYSELGGNTDQAAALFSPELSDAWRRMSEAAGQLDYLSKARDAFSPQGSRADLGNTRLEELSRTAILPGRDILRWSSRSAGIEKWGDLIDRGATLRWQTKAEQFANAEAIALAPVR
jgi:hypothetical protein